MKTLHTNWNTENPPKDGTWIVAVGHVIETDGAFTESRRFCGEVQWITTDSGYTGWMYPTQMAVAMALDDEVYIDWWMPMPSELADSAVRAPSEVAA